MGRLVLALEAMTSPKLLHVVAMSESWKIGQCLRHRKSG